MGFRPLFETRLKMLVIHHDGSNLDLTKSEVLVSDLDQTFGLLLGGFEWLIASPNTAELSVRLLLFY